MALVCLALVPVGTIALRLGATAYLEDRGCRRQIVDPSLHSNLMTIRWTRDATGG